MTRRKRAILAIIILGGPLGACEAEKRAIGPAAPLSAPMARNDPREAVYSTNAYQISEGGRMFRWQGCDVCHTENAPGAARLTDSAWSHGGAVTDLYASIAEGRPGGMPGYQNKIAIEQIWQIAGYVHQLPTLPPAKRARQSSDQQAEPQGAVWNGAIP